MVHKNIKLILLITLIAAPILPMDNNRKASEDVSEQITKPTKTAVDLPPAQQALLDAIPVRPLHDIILGYLNTWAFDYEYDHGGEQILAICYSPDGKSIAARDNTSSGKIRIYDISQKKIVSECVEKHSSYAAYSQNRKYFAAGNATSTSIYNLNDNTLSDIRFTIGDVGDYWTHIGIIAFSPDSQYIATGGLHSFEIYSVLTCARICRKPYDCITSIKFSPDNNCLAVGLFNGTIQFFDIKNQNVSIILGKPTNDPIECLVFSEDNKYLTTVSKKGSLNRWNLKTGLCIKNLKTESPDFAQQSPNGKYLLTQINGNNLCIRDAQTFELLHELNNNQYIEGAACSNTTIATTNKNKVTIWKNQALEIQAEK